MRPWLVQQNENGPQRHISPPAGAHIVWCHGLVVVASLSDKENLLKSIRGEWRAPPGGYYYLSNNKKEVDIQFEDEIGYDPVLIFGMIPDRVESSVMRTTRILACCFRKKYLKTDEGIPRPEEVQDIDCSQVNSILTDEQRKLVDTVVDDSGENLVVQALAGTGKTTTMLHAVRRSSSKAILVTYNRHLCDSTQHKRAQMAIRKEDCVVHTFHSLANWMWEGASVKDDDSLLNILRRIPERCKQDTSLYRLLIIDECQDLKPLYYELIQNLRMHLPTRHKVVLIGDFFQCVYADMQQNASSTAYMESPEKFFGGVWRTDIRLSVSHRITPSVAAWINQELNPQCLSQEDANIPRFWGDGFRSRDGPESNEEEFPLCNAS